MIRKLAVTFGVCGFLIALLLGTLWWYLLTETSINPSNAPILDTLTDWLWPTSLMLMAEHGHGQWFGLFFSATANAVIYSVCGILLALGIKAVRHR